MNPAASPTPLSGWLHQAKVVRRRVLRSFQDRRTPITVLRAAEFEGGVAAEHRSRLYSGDGGELPLELGKVQNLRVACKALDRLVLAGGQVFSFWRQVGRCSRSRGYTLGRQLQEGCLIPAVGGGICQLSNALYQVACEAGLEVVERHTHSRVVPGSAAAVGQDATVAWNYVDLRFRADRPVQLRTFMTDRELVVQVLSSSAATTAAKPKLAQLKMAATAQSCDTCGTESCFRHRPAVPTTGRAAFILDGLTPEWSSWLISQELKDVLLLAPLDGRRWKKPAYAWPVEQFGGVTYATLEALRIAFAQRRGGPTQGARQAQALARSEAIVTALVKRIPNDATELVVAQEFLPYLLLSGALGGRRFTVLASRLPMAELQTALDAAFAQHPESPTLSDFRAPSALVKAESEALAAAHRIITPHLLVAEKFKGKAEIIPWVLPLAKPWVKGAALAYGGPAAARKGAYEIREVARRLKLAIVTTGRNLEGEGFWEGIDITFKPRTDPNWMDGCFALVQPAVVEERPRALLAAKASGIPIIATAACGAECDELIPALNPDALVAAIKRITSKV